MLVVSGTPWFWDQCQVSKKYEVLKYMISVFKDRPKIALGLGSCYPMVFSYSEDYNYIKEIWGQFNFISVRDSIAANLLANNEVQVYSTFCTSSFYPYYPKKEQIVLTPTVVFYEPSIGVSKSILSSEYITKYRLFQIEVIKRYSAQVLVLDEREGKFLESFNIQSHKVLNHYDLMEKLNGSSFVLSGRVHSAIPARMMGIPTYILPVDTRWLTTLNFGITPIFDLNNSLKVPSKNLFNNDIRQNCEKEAEKLSDIIKLKLNSVF